MAPVSGHVFEDESMRACTERQNRWPLAPEIVKFHEEALGIFFFLVPGEIAQFVGIRLRPRRDEVSHVSPAINRAACALFEHVPELSTATPPTVEIPKRDADSGRRIKRDHDHVVPELA